MECVYPFPYLLYIPMLCKTQPQETTPKLDNSALVSTIEAISEVAEVCYGNYETEAKHILKYLLSDANYDTKVPPSGGVDVMIDLIVQDIEDISERSRSFSMDLLYSQIWHDDRLDFHSMKGAECLQNITLNYQMVDKIWIPNVCFINTQAAEVHESPTRNIFLVIYPNGTVWTNYRVKINIPCEMDFSTFPMDVQQCLLVFESFSFNVARVRLQWKPTDPIAFQMNENRKLPQFIFYDHQLFKDNCLYPTGMWDQLKVVFMFRRGLGFYVLQVYVPTVAIVVLSWTSFWIDKEALPARITLGTTSLMAIITQYGIVAQGLPKVSDVKSLDIWTFCCLGFVITTVIELPIVAFYEKRHIRMKRRLRRTYASTVALARSFAIATGGYPALAAMEAKPPRDRSPSSRYLGETSKPSKSHPGSGPGDVVFDSLADHRCTGDSTRSEGGGGPVNSIKQLFRPRRTSKVDQVSRVFFPATFGVFNALYWWYYKVQSKRLLNEMLENTRSPPQGCI